MARKIPAMKIWSVPDAQKHKQSAALESGDYFGQVKKDGHWYQFEKDVDGKNHLFSRNLSTVTKDYLDKIENVPHIEEALGDILPKDTIVIGEIYYPNETSKRVTSVMGALPPKAHDFQAKNGSIHYYIHDIIYKDGMSLLDTAAIDRYNELIKLLGNVNEVPFLKIADIVMSDLENFGNEMLAIGEEGIVCKKCNGVYIPDKKPAWETIKIKQQDTVDAVVMGYQPPTKEYKGTELDSWIYWEGDTPVTEGYHRGWVGALEIGLYNEEGILTPIGTVSSGLTIQLKESIRHNPLMYVGKVVEIQCMSIDSDARTLRHPFLKRFRNDKNDNECTMQEVFR